MSAATLPRSPYNVSNTVSPNFNFGEVLNAFTEGPLENGGYGLVRTSRIAVNRDAAMSAGGGGLLLLAAVFFLLAR